MGGRTRDAPYTYFGPFSSCRVHEPGNVGLKIFLEQRPAMEGSPTEEEEEVPVVVAVRVAPPPPHGRLQAPQVGVQVSGYFDCFHGGFLTLHNGTVNSSLRRLTPKLESFSWAQSAPSPSTTPSDLTVHRRRCSYSSSLPPSLPPSCPGLPLLSLPPADHLPGGLLSLPPPPRSHELRQDPLPSGA